MVWEGGAFFLENGGLVLVLLEFNSNTFLLVAFLIPRRVHMFCQDGTSSCASFGFSHSSSSAGRGGGSQGIASIKPM